MLCFSLATVVRTHHKSNGLVESNKVCDMLNEAKEAVHQLMQKIEEAPAIPIDGQAKLPEA